MIKISRGPKPAILDTNEEQWTQEYIAKKAGETSLPKASLTRYRHPRIKEQIVLDCKGKCAYCESQIDHAQPGDIEHIKPKAKFPEKIVEWENLTLVCKKCNSEKGDFFDANETLIDPTIEDPNLYIQFYGPMIMHTPGQNRGLVTISQLKLERPELFERRKESLKNLQPLIDLWAKETSGSTKSILELQIREHCSEAKEYSFMNKCFVAATTGIEI